MQARVAIVTGGARGIGLGNLLVLAAEADMALIGHRVGVNDGCLVAVD